MMAQQTQNLVMDVLPWPQGQGFQGATAWWEHVLGQDEQKRLDNLMGLALLDASVCDRLLQHQDATLLSAFGLSEATQDRLRMIQANSLADLARGMTSVFASQFALLDESA